MRFFSAARIKEAGKKRKPHGELDVYLTATVTLTSDLILTAGRQDDKGSQIDI